MPARKPQKPQKSSSAPATSKLNLIALKPLKKPEETQQESSQQEVEPSTSVEPVEPVEPAEPSASVESPASVLQPTKKLKPIKRSPAPVPAPPLPDGDNEPVESSNALFQALGVIVGDVFFEDKKAHVTLADKQYPLFYASSHKKAYEALQLTIKKTGQHQQRLLVYPKVMHFPKREQPYRISFQLVGFEGAQQNLGQDTGLLDGEFKLSGLWQFIPVCRTPCLSIFKNFTDERLTYIKEASVEQKVRFMKASHIPVLWRDAPVRPFRFNPKLDQQQQGQASFVGIKAKFLPEQDVFEFYQVQIQPTTSLPKFLKAGKKDKAQAMQLKKAQGKRTGGTQQTAQNTKEHSDGDSTSPDC